MAQEVKHKDSMTEIAVIMDRSGSMSSIKEDMEGGLWSFVEEQKKMEGRCKMSLFHFDTVWEEVFDGRPIDKVTQKDCTLQPRGSTALNDSIVKSLHALEKRILSEDDLERPDAVIVIVITDGKENASRENTRQDARDAAKRMAEKYQWKFLFLAADTEGFEEGASIFSGIDAAGMVYDKKDVGASSKLYSEVISSVRSGGLLSSNAVTSSTEIKVGTFVHWGGSSSIDVDKK